MKRFGSQFITNLWMVTKFFVFAMILLMISIGCISIIALCGYVGIVAGSIDPLLTFPATIITTILVATFAGTLLQNYGAFLARLINKIFESLVGDLERNF